MLGLRHQPAPESTIVIDVARMSRVVAGDRSTYAVHAGREHVVDYTLAQLEQRLDPRRFVGVHRSTLVNVAFVDELYPKVGGSACRRDSTVRPFSDVAGVHHVKNAPSSSPG